MNLHMLLAGVLLTTSGCGLFSGFSKNTAARNPSRAATPPAPRVDPRFEHSAVELEAFITENTEGYTQAGTPIHSSLDAFEPIELKMKRGKCYRFVVRLASDAAFGEHARRGVAFKLDSPGQPTVMGGPGVHGPGAVASAGCPQSDGTGMFDMYANWGSSVDGSRMHELGHGGVTLQLFTRDISEADLQKAQANTERQLAESARFNEEYRRKEAQRREEREARDYGRSSSRPSPSPSPSAPTVVSVSIKNECRKTVKLFFGDKPKFGSGTQSSLGANTRTSRQMRVGDMIWLVDDRDNGISAVTASSGTRNVTILESCNGIIGR